MGLGETHSSVPWLLCRDMPPTGRDSPGSAQAATLQERLSAEPRPQGMPPGVGWAVGFLLPASSPGFHHPAPSPLEHFATHPHPHTLPFLRTPSPGPNTGPYQSFLLITGVRAAHGAATQVNGCTKQGSAEHLMFCLRLPRALSCMGKREQPSCGCQTVAGSRQQHAARCSPGDGHARRWMGWLQAGPPPSSSWRRWEMCYPLRAAHSADPGLPRLSPAHVGMQG